MAQNPFVDFKCVNNITNPEEGVLYFEHASKTIKTLNASGELEAFSGVQSIIVNSDTGIASVIDQNGTSFDLNYIPFSEYDDESKTFAIYNKSLQVADLYNNNSNTRITLDGQSVYVLNKVNEKTDKATILSNDGFASVSSTSYDVLDDPEQYMLVSIRSDDTGLGGITLDLGLNQKDSEQSSNLTLEMLPTLIKHTISMLGGTKLRKVSTGFGDNSSNLFGDNGGDYLVKIEDSVKGTSLYAFKNAGLGNDDEPAYVLVDGDAVKSAAFTGGKLKIVNENGENIEIDLSGVQPQSIIDDDTISEDTTWSSSKIKSELNKSVNIRYYETKQDFKNDTTRVPPCICYIKEYDKIIYDDGSPIPDTYIWNFSDSKFFSLGTITSNTTVDDLTIHANSTNNVQINAYRTTIGAEEFTYRMYLSGDGNMDYRSVSFNLTGNDDITIYFQTSNNRILRLVKEDGTILHNYTGTTAQSQSFHYSGEPCTVYLYMASGSGYIYCIKLND